MTEPAEPAAPAGGAPIDYSTFESVQLRVGTIVSAEPNPKARRPAYVLQIDLGPAGMRTSSAQLTDLYRAEELVGRQVVCACNFEPKRIAGVKSEVLVLGAYDAQGRVSLAGFAIGVPNGAELC